KEMHKLLEDVYPYEQWSYEYDEKGRLKKCVNVILGPEKITDILFDYDDKNQLQKYTLYTVDEKVISSVFYTYKNGLVESELIYTSNPQEYYLANVPYREKRYNKKGDLIADLYKVKPEYEDLVRNQQKYLDRYFVY